MNNQHVTAFGYAAFAESLLRIGIGRMHSSGVSIQASAPGGVKGLWLMSFLRYQFLLLLQDNSDAPTPPGVAPGAGKMTSFALGGRFTPDSEASTRPPTRENPPATESFPGGRSQTPTASLSPGHQPWASPGGKKEGGLLAQASTGFGTFNVPHSSGTKTWAPFRRKNPPENSPAEREEDPPSETIARLTLEEMPPTGSSYTSFRTRLFGKHPDMFQRFDQGRLLDGQPLGSFVEDASRIGEVCSICQRRRNRRGVGDVFCHGCSGIDKGILSQSVMYPVLDRRRLKINMQAPDHNSPGRLDRNLGASTDTSMTATAADANSKETKDGDGSRRMNSHGSATPSGSPNLSTMQIDESPRDGLPSPRYELGQ